MWDIVAAGTTAVLGIFVSFLFILYDRQHLKDISVMNSIPGPSPEDEDANLGHINREGLVSFLTNLHKQWGDLASFWIGKDFFVTTSAPGMFKKVKSLDNRPGDFLKPYKYMLGETSIWFANGSSWRIRSACYRESFSRQYLLKYFEVFSELSKSLTKSWQTAEPAGISFESFSRDVRLMTCKATLTNLFGDNLLRGEDMQKLIHSYEQCINLSERMEIKGEQGNAESLREESLRVRHLIKECINKRKLCEDKNEDLLIDRIIEKTTDDELCADDCMAFLSGGLHKMTTLLVWAIAYLSMNPELQKRLRKEILQGTSSDNAEYEEINAIRYLRQFINETLRCSRMSPLLARRTLTEIVAPGGMRVIPEKTTVIQCLAHEFDDANIWEEPARFDPDRFETDKMEKRAGRTFEPFGYAGNRRCPGMRYSYLFASVFLVYLMRNNDVTNTQQVDSLKCTKGLVHRIIDNSSIRIMPYQRS